MDCLLYRTLLGLSQLVRAAAVAVWVTGGFCGSVLGYSALATEAGCMGVLAGVILTPLTYLIAPIYVFFTTGSGELLAVNFGSMILGAWLHDTAGSLRAAGDGLADPQPQQAVT
jgi:hypothetical protein